MKRVSIQRGTETDGIERSKIEMQFLDETFKLAAEPSYRELIEFLLILRSIEIMSPLISFCLDRGAVCCLALLRFYVMISRFPGRI